MPALRGPKRTGPIGELVPGDDVEVARILARLGRKPLKEPITYAIKVTGDREADDQVTAAEDGFFIWPIEWDVQLLSLVAVGLSCSTVSSNGDIVVNLRKIFDEDVEPPIDLLTVPITIPEGYKHHWKMEAIDPDAMPVVDLEHSQFEYGDEIAVDFDEIGENVRGYTIHFWFR